MKKTISILLALIMCFGAIGFTVFASNDTPFYGDVNDDGLVDNLDAATVLKYDAGLTDLTDEALLCADVNSDGFADNLDAANILKYDAGIYDDVFGEPLYSDTLPTPTDMDKREFCILQRWFGFGKETVNFQGEVIWDESVETGNMSGIDLAKKKVLESVQKDYNCTITGEILTDTAGNVRTYIQEDILSGDPAFDFYFETYYYYYAFVQNGFLVDLNNLGIDFSAPWWDQNAVEDLSIDGRLYYALGDINTFDNDGTYALLFNKTLCKENGIDPDSLYTMAKEGKWTFNELADLVSGFGTDSNGDGVRNEMDTYGFLTEIDNLYRHVIAAGEKSVTKNADDCPVFALDNERVYAVNNDAVDLYFNENDVLVADKELYKSQYEGQDIYEQTVKKAFKEGRGLFYMTDLLTVNSLKDMEDEFGILPVPMYDRGQGRYYHAVDTLDVSCLFVPSTTLSHGEKGKQLGTVIDALGAYSKDYLTAKYYDKVLDRGNGYDGDSAPMLDIILGSRSFDLGAVFGAAWSSPTDLCNHLDKNMRSRVNTIGEIIEISISDSMEKIKEANNH